MNLQLNSVHKVAKWSDDLDRAVTLYRDKIGARFVVRFVIALSRWVPRLVGRPRVRDPWLSSLT
ncbi:MAG: hypothetical protein VX733_01665 [Candidatus Latescibacterota bacterium]|nr:hypothetical protein [Candidatus Latescibacterota bacterium]